MTIKKAALDDKETVTADKETVEKIKKEDEKQLEAVREIEIQEKKVETDELLSSKVNSACTLKGLSHGMDLAFDEMHGQF